MMKFLIPVIIVILLHIITKVSDKIARSTKRPVIKKKENPKYESKDIDDFIRLLSKNTYGKKQNQQKTTWAKVLEQSLELQKENKSLTKAQSLMDALKEINPTYHSLAVANNADVSAVPDEEYEHSKKISELADYLDSLDKQFGKKTAGQTDDHGF